jgi:hypothetical protein
MPTQQTAQKCLKNNCNRRIPSFWRYFAENGPFLGYLRLINIVALGWQHDGRIALFLDNTCSANPKMG